MRKFISILMVVAMVLSVCVFPASAESISDTTPEEPKENSRISAGCVNAFAMDKQDTVTVPVFVENGIGQNNLNAFAFYVDFDEALTLVGAKGVDLGDGIIEFGEKYENHFFVSYVKAYALDGNRHICDLTFKLPEGVQSGDIFDVKIVKGENAEDSDCYGEDFEPIPVDRIAGSITVLNPSYIEAGHVTALSGDRVSVPVKVVSSEDTNKYNAFAFYVRHDPALKLVDVISDESFGKGGILSTSESYDENPYFVSYVQAYEIENGEHFIDLIFETPADEGTYSVDLIRGEDAWESDCYDEEFNPVLTALISGSVTVKKTLPSLFTAGSASVFAGCEDTVTIPVYVDNGLGQNNLNAFAFYVDYDESLTLVDAKGVELDGGIIEFGENYENHFFVSYVKDYAITSDLHLCDLTFKLPANAKSGESYEISIVKGVNAEDSDCYGEDFAPIPVQRIAGEIKTIAPSYIEVGSADAEAGELFTVPVNVNVSDYTNSYTSFAFYVKYDPALKLVEAVRDFGFGEGGILEVAENTSDNPYFVMYVQAHEVAIDGHLMDLVFEAPDAEGTYNIEIVKGVNAEDSDCYDDAFVPVPTVRVPGTVTVTKTVDNSKIYAGNVKGFAVEGQNTVTVPVFVHNGEEQNNFNALAFYVDFADGLKLIDAKGVELDGGIIEFGEKYENHFFVTYIKDYAITGDLHLCDLTFEIPEGAVAGDVFDISIVTGKDAEDSDCYDEEFEPIFVERIAGSIKVLCPSYIGIGNVEAEAGKQFTVPVNVGISVDTKAYTSFAFYVKYDPALKLIGTVRDNSFGDGGILEVSENVSDNPYFVMYVQPHELASSGHLMDLVFEAPDAEGIYEIEIVKGENAEDSDCYDEDFAPVPTERIAGYVQVGAKVVQAQNEWTTPLTMKGWNIGETAQQPSAAAKYGTVRFIFADEKGNVLDGAPTKAGKYTVKAVVDATEEYTGLESGAVEFTVVPAIPGNFLNDDKINSADAVLLLRYLANWDISGYNTCLESADVNGDGNINTTDVILIFRYVAGWQLDVKIGW